MKKNLLKIIVLAIIMIMGISSVCFADLIATIPGEDIAWTVGDFLPIIVIMLVLAIIETLSFYFLCKTQKEDTEEKERKEEKFKKAKYHLVFMLTLCTLLIPMINILSLVILCISLIVLVIIKNKKLSYSLLKYYLMIFVILFVIMFVSEMIAWLI